MKYPQTKNEAKAYESEGIRWGISKDAGKVVVSYLNDLGARHEIPDSKEGIVEYVNDYHRAMVLRNEYMPKDIPFHIIYPPFFSAVVNEFVKTPEFQPWIVVNQLKAFKKWITKGGQLDKLYERFYREYPDSKPKQIEGSTQDTKMEDRPDSWIREAYSSIVQIYGDEIPEPPIIGTRAFMKRVETEYRRRGLDRQN